MALVPLHIAAGFAGLVSGAVALYALKGAKLHRKSGMVFVCAMLIMSTSGAVMAAMKPERLSVIAGALTFYLVTTALLTVWRPARKSIWIDVGAMLMAFAVGLAGIEFGFDALSNASGTVDGDSAPPFFVFGSVALLAALLDLRMILARGIHGAHRLARHLWRMCFALLMAATAFFLGQEQLFPEPVRKFALLVIPSLLILLLMLYWLVRVLFTRWHSPPDSVRHRLRTKTPLRTITREERTR